MPDDRALVVVLGGRRAGHVAMDASGQLSFAYDEGYAHEPGRTPLSLSMPVGHDVFTDSVVRPFLWGLLPESGEVLRRWGSEFQVSPLNPFALLRHVGEDCAGAVQFVRPARVDAVLDGQSSVTWLDHTQIEERLRALRIDPSYWRPYGSGRFSLAGAQAKMALCFDPVNRRWGEPAGAAPTTHIFKPAISGLEDHDVNEHVCLAAARLTGLPVARSDILTFGGERAIVSARYDRHRDARGHCVRVHQEDLCQAFGLPPGKKYQNEGGPTPEAIIGLLRRAVAPVGVAAEQIDHFVGALAFNWAIGGTDAHAKNYSVLLSGAQVRLAPFYDVASILPYDNVHVPKLRLAMKIGGEYRLDYLSGRHWRRFAQTNGLDPDGVVDRVRDLLERVPDAFTEATDAPELEQVRSELPVRLTDQVSAQATRCLRRLAH